MHRRRAGVASASSLLTVPGGRTVQSLAERQRDTAEYLAEMILELRNLARSVRLHTIMVPLEFAYYEAFGTAHRVEVPPADLKRLRDLAMAAESFDKDPGNTGI